MANVKDLKWVNEKQFRIGDDRWLVILQQESFIKNHVLRLIVISVSSLGTDMLKSFYDRNKNNSQE